MKGINIKVHPPWYARGTPFTNTRDGPPMVLSELSLFAICEGPSARGEQGECMNAGMHECENSGDERSYVSTLFLPLVDVKNHIFQHAKRRVLSYVCGVGKENGCF